MTFELPPLPYAIDALAPHISKETLEYHYGKHHRAYVTNLNNLITGNEFENMSLEDIIKKATGGIFNNAAQVWNHTFYWHSLSPNGGGEPTGHLADAIKKYFGSFADFKTAFTKAALTQFGSGWVWLVKNNADELEILQTGNAGNPLLDGKKPLLTCDVWEHAYYIDTRNDRAKYVEHFWNLVNWEFAEKNLG
ncbi:MAG: superoxide dismutase [Fe] [Gammaproteobacteria bacterium CG_4_10_14_0_8_um_filter_38_16]|nr:MAG: superoxide dismutase [Fe] [Gammaproteobacteria bacterium CG_4_10_14_0_8_um_filter_38_16]PJA03891.1 MAG: superoxide dismutase [Fe] [Gammaproteobacteria bacterium CG_4_10_14_0_2_um_filter_38_22]PJB09495.1 MAG: superoxide dismutase [Fe] [Gammaproteobacteria bacterium CG_4_9_14_3_um_filter_38_9]